jgi:hypothetical protein
MAERLTVNLEPAEYEALSRLAERDLRTMPMQARYVIRRALIEAGLLTEKGEPSWPKD